MKFTTLVIAAASVTLLSLSAQAQTDTTTIKLSDLETPSSPAFVLLDAAPTSIARPMTSKAFSASMLSIVNQNGGAVEFTPYWFIKNSKMTAAKYYGLKENGKQNVFAQAKLLAISFAMVNSTPASSYNVSNLSLGVRTTLIRANKRASTQRYSESLIAINKKLASFIDSIAQDPQIDPLSPNKNALIAQKMAKLIAADSTYQQARAKIAGVVNEKPLFTLELAAGYNVAFDSTDFKAARTARIGTWINADYLAYQNASTYLHLTGLARYIYDKNSKNSEARYVNNDCFDFGGKVELEVGKFSGGAEYVKRLYLDNTSQNTERIAANIRYKISADFYVNGTLGNNFGKNALLTLFGFQWTIGSGNEKVQIK
jgi:hypothetical protein